MRIGDLSRRTGVSVRLLRYYEEQGLLRPLRRPSGYREYLEDDVRTVQNIRTLLGAGLSTRTIAALLPCMVDDGQLLAPACSGMLSDLQREQERIDRAVADLQAARAVLDTIMAATLPHDVAEEGACRAAADLAPADFGALLRGAHH
ncbi:MerR family transcriptional regulator [Streptomyces eurythermus]|uniref:MerR family transcriptional regulator n=1 Tax=Streptomyces eurythermus TaxID=42237 RepID=UPI00367D510E